MRKRNIRVEVRFTEPEYAAFMENVKKAGMNRESYLRSLAQNCVPRAFPPLDYFKMTKELHAIGRNLHQIAARANATGFFMAKELQEFMKRHSEFADRIDAWRDPDTIDGNHEDLGS